MCILPLSPTAEQPSSTPAPARSLPPPQRQQLALDALAGQPIAPLASDHHGRRKFGYHQLSKAHDALDHAFTPPADEPEQLLFWLPVTKPWLEQLVLGLTLVCHSPLRG